MNQFVFDPSRSLNAFSAGAQIGSGIRQAQTNSRLAPLIAQGDFQGAAKVAGERGDLPSAELYGAQYQDQLAQMGEADRTAAAERAQQLGKLAYSVRNLPYEQRQQAIANSMPMLQQMGMDPQSIAGFDPTDQSLDTLIGQVTDLSKMLEPKVVADGGQVWQGNRMIGENPKDPKAPAPGMIQDEAGNWVYSPEYLAGQERMRAAGRSQTNINMPGNEGWKFAPPPSGYGYAPNPNAPGGVELVPIQGGPVASEQAAADAKTQRNNEGTALTVGSLINSYSTLAKNKAITAQGNTAVDNAAALYSGTGLGQLQDQLGGEVGNLENAEARKNIEGLSMNALMKMISMSDVSAKAMDSDAEMKAWLSAIKSDNYESALTKLHVLDKSFGDGMALQKAYEAGTIDLPTYQYVTKRANSDSYAQQMVDRLLRYRDLGQAVGESNLTTGERQATADLQGLLAGDGTPVTEDDIQTTMAKYGMTREEVIARLRGQ